VLPQIYPPAGNSIDIPAVVAQIAAEVRRIVSSLDAHEIKEQVSDLVVERLDSRLAVRDRVLEGLSSKLVDGLDNIMEPVNSVVTCVEEVSKGQEALSIQTRDLATSNNEAMTLLSGLPEQLSSATEPLRNMLTDLVSSSSAFGKEGVASSEDVLRIGSGVESLSTGQQAMQDKIAELLALHQTVLSSLADLPDTMTASIKAAQQTQAELLADTVSRKDFEDVMKGRISSAEAERDLLRAKVDEIQAVMLLRATDAAAAQSRATELEEALNRSLARLKTSDVTIEGQQERLLELEKLNRELISEKQTLVTKVGFIAQIFFLSSTLSPIL
jgi:chromosome segregation ATPase